VDEFVVGSVCLEVFQLHELQLILLYCCVENLSNKFKSCN